MSSKKEKEPEKMDESPERLKDLIGAFFKIGFMYAETSKDEVVLGFKDNVLKAQSLFQDEKYTEVYDIIADIYKDELKGVRDREFRWCIRDIGANLVDLMDALGIPDGETSKKAKGDE